jgi:hypothetical protein
MWTCCCITAMAAACAALPVDMLKPWSLPPLPAMKLRSCVIRCKRSRKSGGEAEASCMCALKTSPSEGHSEAMGGWAASSIDVTAA